LNDLLTQGLATGDLIALFTQGLTVEIIERRPLNGLLTQGLATGIPIALLTQGLIGKPRLIVFRPVHCLPIGLDFQLFVMDLAIATPSINSIVLDGASNQIITEVLVPAIDLTPSLDMLSLFNNIVLDGASGQIITEVLVPAIDLTVDCSEVILNETIVNLAG